MKRRNENEKQIMYCCWHVRQVVYEALAKNSRLLTMWKSVRRWLIVQKVQSNIQANIQSTELAKWVFAMWFRHKVVQCCREETVSERVPSCQHCEGRCHGQCS